jgi:hypothetical protein
MGVQFADATTAVNRIYVYVDDALTPQVAAALTWAAYRSDDNQVWTLVPSGGVQFDPPALRFEIPIATTQARYLKVVTPPLSVAVTSAPEFEAVLVTEVQALTSTTTCIVP